jgi:uncharacterized lipoprotein YehR (DUF1307 family)
MKKNRMITTLLLALVMTFALTACGGNDKPASNSPSGGTPTSDTAKPVSGSRSSADGTLKEADIVGQWDGDAWGIWEFRADGTALINGEENENYTFKEDGIYELTDSKNIEIGKKIIVDGNTMTYTASGGNDIVLKRK